MVSSKKTHSQKMKNKYDDDDEGRKMFINVNLMGSSGPIRFFVGRNQTVESVIETAVETFARQGRLPVLGCKPQQFALYCPTDSGWQVLELSEAIGLEGRWNFRLCKKRSAAITNNCDTATNKSGLMKKSNDEEGGRMMFINVNFVGSDGPIQFYVSQKQTVESVIETALETFARQGRPPILGCKPHQFALYCSTNSGWQAKALGYLIFGILSIFIVLEPSEAIGLERGWNFKLCKNPSTTTNNCATTTRSKSGLLNFKSWFRTI
ncbi:unnamed protein product [Citrullus colocynthis]|uniref:DUF7054 domain-containing protein n=1 Tax=Citrullus colocynthis TaxID=252529 RepID=A0ABP0Z885_9ROSI